MDVVSLLIRLKTILKVVKNNTLAANSEKRDNTIFGATLELFVFLRLTWSPYIHCTFKDKDTTTTTTRFMMKQYHGFTTSTVVTIACGLILQLLVKQQQYVVVFAQMTDPSSVQIGDMVWYVPIDLLW